MAIRCPACPASNCSASYLGVSILHFWGTETLTGDEARQADVQRQYLALRDRMIGALLRQARTERAISEELSQASSIPVAQLERYELGEDSLPMHELTVLATQVRRNMNYFLETGSYIGRLLAARQDWAAFAEGYPRRCAPVCIAAFKSRFHRNCDDVKPDAHR